MGEAKDRLKAYFERFENLADEAGAIREAVKSLSAEVKADGFKPAAVKKLVALRSKDKAKLIEDREIVELYAHALGVEDLV